MSRSWLGKGGSEGRSGRGRNLREGGGEEKGVTGSGRGGGGKGVREVREGLGEGGVGKGREDVGGGRFRMGRKDASEEQLFLTVTSTL